jgi:CheY-like chemotaxis protein
MPLVLVVDDDDDIRESFRDLLERNGHAVAEARNGSEAISYLRSEPTPSLVLLDLMMPILNGWQVLEVLESEGWLATLPVTVISAVAEAGSLPPGVRMLRKPVTGRSVLAEVAAACSH